ncbi:MAG TPA: enolase C-terminal domain-like protein [Phycisphaerae bacterium]|nr:enolase C-terminal domain-like protein [Phycisphaerae bacterium]
MPDALPIARLTIHQLAIPLRVRFRHAAAERNAANPLVVAIELADRTIGYGETHPREYVTGESTESVIAAIQDVFLPILVDTRPRNFGEAIEAAANLPYTTDADEVITAARAAVELALLDAYSRAFDRSLAHVAGYVDETLLGPPGSSATVRFSGVVSAGEPDRAARTIRRMRWARLCDFKIKVGDDEDDARVRACVRALGRSLTRERTTLRLDANGGWSLDEATRRLLAWESLPIACVEQPLPKGNLQDWADLAKCTVLPLMADESLVTPDDAEALIVHRAASWFNIRISKNGGLIPALRLAVLARRHHLDLQLGCMVGETSVLSAAGRWFLQLVPHVRFAEGSFGRFLLAEDITRRSLRFGLGGCWKPMTGPGLGVEVDPARLERLAAQPSIELPF